MLPTNHWSSRQLPRLITWLRWLLAPNFSERRASARSGRPKPSRRSAWYQTSSAVETVWPASHTVIALVTVRTCATPSAPLSDDAADRRDEPDAVGEPEAVLRVEQRLEVDARDEDGDGQEGEREHRHGHVAAQAVEEHQQAAEDQARETAEEDGQDDGVAGERAPQVRLTAARG